MQTPLKLAFDRLLAHFGPQSWWPGGSRFEIIVGAVLVQSTSWRNVEQAIDNLREAGVLAPEALAKLEVEELEELVRPATTGSRRVGCKTWSIG